MPIEVKMPRLSLTMESGSVVQWLKEPGARVEKGEDLAEIETDKVNVVLEAPASGYLRALLVEPGVTVACDSAIALLTATADEPLHAASRSAASALPAAEPPPIAATDAAPPAHAQSAMMASAPPVVASPPDTIGLATTRAHVNASPAAKNLARQLDVDLALITGTGPGGRIGLEDVQRAANARTAPRAGAPEQPGPAAHAAPLARDMFPAMGQPEAGDRRMRLSRMRAAIAQRMATALAVPQFTVHRQVDMTAALRVRQAHAAAGDRAPGVIDLIHLAVTRALLTHPEVNASFHAGESPEQSEIALHAGVDLGIALALPDGLIVPVIRDAHTMGLQALAAERLRLQEEARAGRLAVSALGGATFTVSNLGPLHVDTFTAIVTPPEVAILAVGQMQETLVVRDGAIHIVPRIALTVTADHRALDGAQVAHFLETLATNLDRLEMLA